MALKLSAGTLDMFDNTDARRARLIREAAATMRVDPHFEPEERERRARAYEDEAAELERGR